MDITDEMVTTFYNVMTSTPDNIVSPVREDIRAGLTAVFSEYIEAELSTGQIAYEPHVLDTWARALDLAERRIAARHGDAREQNLIREAEGLFRILLNPPEVP